MAKRCLQPDERARLAAVLDRHGVEHVARYAPADARVVKSAVRGDLVDERTAERIIAASARLEKQTTLA